MSFTGRSPSINRSRMSRRRGSATALNTSAVVAARATTGNIYPYRYMSSEAENQLRRLERDVHLWAVADAVQLDPVGEREQRAVARRRPRPRQELVRSAPHDPGGA